MPRPRVAAKPSEDIVDASIARRAVAAALIGGLAAELLFDRVALGINVPIATIGTLVLVTLLGNGLARRTHSTGGCRGSP